MDRIEAATRRMMQQKFRHLGRKALYFMDPAASNPTPVMVCITDRQMAVSAAPASVGLAEFEVDAPHVEFLRSQVEPVRGAFISVERGLAYQVDTVLPVEGITITAKVTRVKSDKLRNFPVPQRP